jgi:CHAT domain-containing protein
LALGCVLTACTTSSTILPRPGEEAPTASQAGELAPYKALANAQMAGPSFLMNPQALAAEGVALLADGDYPRSEEVMKQAIAKVDGSMFKGPNHFEHILPMLGLATAYYRSGDYADAETTFQKLVPIEQSPSGLGFEMQKITMGMTGASGAFFLSPGYVHESLGDLYVDEGRYAQAASMYQQSEQECESTAGRDHYQCAGVLGNLGSLYAKEHLYTTAEPLMLRALEIDRKSAGPNSKEVSTDLGRLARLYAEEGDYAKAENYYQQALRLREKLFGENHRYVADTLTDLADTYRMQRRYSEAEPLYLRAIDIRERALGVGHADVAGALDGLARVYNDEGSFSKAEPIAQRALKIREEQFGEENLAFVQSLNTLAKAKAGSGDRNSARSDYERARKILIRVRRSNTDLADQAIAGLLKDSDHALLDYLALLATSARSSAADTSAASARWDAFVVAEQARGSAAQAAMARTAILSAAQEPTTKELARSVEDLRNRHEAITKQIDLAYTDRNPNTKLLENLHQQEQALGAQLHEANQRLVDSFPQYVELIAPEPTDLSETRKLLGPDEALISYSVLDERVLSWMVRANSEPDYRDIAVNGSDLKAMIARVRASLRPDRPYDVADAFELYQLLLQPFADKLSGIKRLVIVPDGELFSLSFGALVTSQQGDAYKRLADAYRGRVAPSPAELRDDYPRIAWLAKQPYSLVLLPSATSLRLLKQIAASKRRASDPFVGIGDPLLNGAGNDRGGVMLVARGTRSIEDIRELPRLPGTRDELLAEAHALGADPSRDLFMEDRATRAAVMDLNRERLANVRVVSFATHALTGGELKGYVEPALVLTPPRDPLPDDNGLLTLDDIVGLHLGGSEWVVLSACNTADGADGLSGLVRGFFFAGAPALLVSQWSVDDAATDQLMTDVFTAYGRKNDASRAAALHDAMLKLMTSETDPGHTYFAHPFAWAPFIVVGEGGAGSF